MILIHNNKQKVSKIKTDIRKSSSTTNKNNYSNNNKNKIARILFKELKEDHQTK